MNFLKFCQSESNSQEQISKINLQASNQNKGTSQQDAIVNIPVYFTTHSNSGINNNSKKLLKKQSRQSKKIYNSDYICQCIPANTNQNNISGQVIITNKKTNFPVYEGEYFNSQKNGYGIQYDNKGQILYEGQFRNGKRDGWGRTKEYQGQFRDNEHDGWGRYMTPQIFYEGYFNQGMYNGTGIQIQAEQQFKNFNQLKNKKSKLDQFFISQLGKENSDIFNRFGISQLYIGQWAKGQKNGSGKLWKQNGEWYNGQFSFGTIHGTGAQFQVGQESVVKKGFFAKGTFQKTY